jgi:hypothetical protein
VQDILVISLPPSMGSRPAQADGGLSSRQCSARTRGRENVKFGSASLIGSLCAPPSKASHRMTTMSGFQGPRLGHVHVRDGPDLRRAPACARSLIVSACMAQELKGEAAILVAGNDRSREAQGSL